MGPWMFGNEYGHSEQPGATFCQSSEGSGVDDPNRQPAPKAGVATAGNCVNQFCVNDLKH